MHGSPECESSNAERQGQLDSDLPADVALDELLQCFGDLAAFGRNPAIQFLGDFLGSIARPAFDWIESNHPQNVSILAGKQVGDQSGVLDALVGLAKGGTAPEIFEQMEGVP